MHSANMTKIAYTFLGVQQRDKHTNSGENSIPPKVTEVTSKDFYTV